MFCQISSSVQTVIKLELESIKNEKICKKNITKNIVHHSPQKWFSDPRSLSGFELIWESSPLDANDAINYNRLNFTTRVNSVFTFEPESSSFRINVRNCCSVLYRKQLRWWRCFAQRKNTESLRWILGLLCPQHQSARFRT